MNLTLEKAKELQESLVKYVADTYGIKEARHMLDDGLDYLEDDYLDYEKIDVNLQELVSGE